MMNNFSAVPLMKGIVEEVEISELSLPKFTIHEKSLENIDELALSILQYGLLNPVIARIKDSQFEVICGTRRFLACKKLRWKKIPCHVIEVSDKDSFEISLVENIQRKNLNPIEEASAFKCYTVDFGWGGVSELATKISKSISYVSRRLSLLELPEEILNEVAKLNINPSTAEELVHLKDHPMQLEIANDIIKRDLTVRDVRKLAHAISVSDPYETLEYKPVVDSKENRDMKINRCFDKVLTSLKINQNKIGTIIEEVDDNWIVYEILMQHKNMINSQIDILIREKKRFNQKLKNKIS
jgi:ParB family transcriptional regulator, chromosome partitioning protein